jgi:hypothetical protein
MYALLIVVCPFVLFLLAIVLSVLLRYTDSDCAFDIFKLFLKNQQPQTEEAQEIQRPKERTSNDIQTMQRKL